MNFILNISFCFNLSLLILHEMDAIRNMEWKMFIFLKNLKEEVAYKIFSILHIPLIILVLYSLTQFMRFYFFLYLIIDIFLILHMIIHYFFTDHEANKFSSSYSKFIIYLMGYLSIFHLVGVITMMQ